MVVVVYLTLLAVVSAQDGRWRIALQRGRSFQEVLDASEVFYHTGNQYEERWNYHLLSPYGPSHWGEFFPHCNRSYLEPFPAVPHMTRQSPININTRDVHYGNNFRIRWLYSHPVLRGNITESHKAPTFEVDSTSRLGRRVKRSFIMYPVIKYKMYHMGNWPQGLQSNRYYLTGVPGFQGRAFILHQFHFHFRDRGLGGSEHSIDGWKYDAEVHFVHYDSKYPSYDAAAKDPGEGLLVVAMFLKVGHPVDLTMARLLQKFYPLRYRFDYSVNIRPAALLKRDFYIYEGGTTSPSCHEQVVWLVQRQPILISPKHLSLLRTLRYKNYNNGERIALFGNSRPLQTYYRPTVYANFRRPRRFV